MHDITQPFIHLTMANMALMTHLKPTPDACAALMRGLADNYAAFVKAYLQVLTGLAVDGEATMINAADRLRHTGYN